MKERLIVYLRGSRIGFIGAVIRGQEERVS